MVEIRCIGLGAGAAGDGGIFQRGLDIEQRAGHFHQPLVVGDLTTSDKGVDVPGLLLDDFAQVAQAQHRQGVGDTLQAIAQRGQVRHVALVAADEDVQLILDRQQVFLDY